jgi:hypothetical protein
VSKGEQQLPRTTRQHCSTSARTGRVSQVGGTHGDRLGKATEKLLIRSGRIATTVFPASSAAAALRSAAIVSSGRLVAM